MGCCAHAIERALCNVAAEAPPPWVAQSPPSTYPTSSPPPMPYWSACRAWGIVVQGREEAAPWPLPSGDGAPCAAHVDRRATRALARARAVPSPPPPGNSVCPAPLMWGNVQFCTTPSAVLTVADCVSAPLLLLLCEGGAPRLMLRTHHHPGLSAGLGRQLRPRMRGPLGREMGGALQPGASGACPSV